MLARMIALTFLLPACASGDAGTFDFVNDYEARLLTAEEQAQFAARIEGAERLRQLAGTTYVTLAVEGGEVVAVSGSAGLLNQLYPEVTEKGRRAVLPTVAGEWLSRARARLREPSVIGYSTLRGTAMALPPELQLAPETQIAIGPGAELEGLPWGDATYIAHGELTSEFFDLVVLRP